MTPFYTQFSSKKQLCALFGAAFVLRATVFVTYIQPYERYRQADSMDYHNCALGLLLKNGLVRADTGHPIFWRTPGYPIYLAQCYTYAGITHAAFEHNKAGQSLAIWGQIVLSSFIPLILLYLALALTQSIPIAWATAFIATVHLGMVLASTYLLTEGLGLIFFYLFLLFLYRSISQESHYQKRWFFLVTAAALCLGIFAWIRPMGEFVAVLSVLTFFIFSSCSMGLRLKKSALFMLIFFTCTGSWYIRNYHLTGKVFFCPMFGPYLNSFTGPKVLRSISGKSLEDCIRLLYNLGHKEELKELERLKGTNYVVARETVVGKYAWQLIYDYPLLTAYEWIKEVIKTSFDLYACQLTAFASNTFTWDPLEEFLLEKTANCLYKQPIPLAMRIISILELISIILVWIGIIGSTWLYGISSLFTKKSPSEVTQYQPKLLLAALCMSAAVVGMTGGFGYARLRLPIEPLLIIISLTFWLSILQRKK